jgi:hypothetical protein
MQARRSTREFIALAQGLTVHAHSFTALRKLRMIDGFWKDRVA